MTNEIFGPGDSTDKDLNEEDHASEDLNEDDPFAEAVEVC